MTIKELEKIHNQYVLDNNETIQQLLGIIKTLTSKAKQQDELITEINKKLNVINTNLTTLDKNIVFVNTHNQRINERCDGYDLNIQTINEDIKKLSTNSDTLNENLKILKTNIDNNDNKMVDLSNTGGTLSTIKSLISDIDYIVKLKEANKI